MVIIPHKLFYVEMCPKGDDPITINQESRSFSVDVIGLASLNGYVAIQFQTVKILLDLASPSPGQCESAFEASGKFRDVSCTFTSLSLSHYRFTVVVLEWPLVPAENNLYAHNGNPPLSDFMCDVSLATTAVRCNFTDVIASNIKGKVLIVHLSDNC
jgi:hypothetical protein